jgi:CO/xanthine dehydrogenase Mo-binding subunit
VSLADGALDADGNFLAVRLTSFGNMGGFLANVGPMPSTMNAVKNVQSAYRTPLIEVSTKCVFTNTTHVSAYRGAGRPEGNYYMERLIDTAAAEMEIDRLELRRRNYIRPRELRFEHDDESVVRYVSVSRDHAAQLQTVRFRYERSAGGKVVGNEHVTFQMRWFWRFELEHLLARAGFSDVQIYGDYDRRPVGADTPAFVVVARS